MSPKAIAALAVGLAGTIALTDAAGHYVRVSNLEGSLSGASTFVVRTSSDPAGARIRCTTSPPGP
ncbi:hypothetical protein [Kitasatospora sp. NPDC057738]|uniref:hypothetical protein n=1 Tax=Kitasatospora sp. NPDC057738 TaxID=3346233 RepID=UPI003688FD88